MKFAPLLLMLAASLLASRTIAEPVTNLIVSPAGQIRTLKQQVDDAYAAYYTATNDASGKLWDAYSHLNDASVPKIFELAKNDPASETSFEAFVWVVTNRRISVRSLRPYGHQSLELLRDFHTTKPGIVELCRHLGNAWDPMDEVAIDFLRRASSKNPDHNASGFATFALGQKLKQRADETAFFPLQPPVTNQWWLQAKADYETQLKQTSVEKLSTEAGQFFETVLAKYADCPMPSRHGIRATKATLGEEVKSELYELNHLMIGKAAPELAGKEIGGSDLKLSQYRGEVVALSFWASWCGPCMQMIPLERALTERFKGQPFTMLGVNGDSSPEDAKRAVKKEQISWPSFWSQGGANGVIPDQWNVHGWPTVYVLDPDGIIRLKFEGYGGITSNLVSETVSRLLVEFKGRKK